MWRTLALAVVLALGLALAGSGERTPSPAPLSTPAVAFSAARAFADVRVIARSPHPIGSAANLRVRDHLIARLAALGLSPQVQRAAGVYQPRGGGGALAIGGVPENIVGVLPGRSRTAPALLLMAHYDSVPGSAGAPDDASGVAAVLETVRALKAQGVPARDVIVLLSDGEEAGLLGADAFFHDHPLARRVGFVINLESRGSSGRATMFETGADNGAVVDLFAAASRQPTSNSLAVFVYKQLPNDTDFSVPKARGLTGLNYAFSGREFDYHSPSATPANLDLGSLQHLGSEALGAARAVAFANRLPAAAPDKVYSSLFGAFVLAYPAAVGWLVLALAGGLIALAAWRARRDDALGWADIARGVGTGSYVLAAAAAAQHLIGRAATGGRGYLESRALLAQFGLFEVAVATVGLAALLLTGAAVARGRVRLAMAGGGLLLGAAGSLFGGLDVMGLGLGAAAAVLALLSFGRPAATPGAWIGVLAIGLIVAIAAQVAAPLTAFVLAWPLLAAALAAAVTDLGRRKGAFTWGVALLAMVFAAGWLIEFSHMLLVGMKLAEGPAPAVWLMALALWPLLHTRGRWRWVLGASALVIGLAAGGALRFAEPWNARYPRAELVVYQQDADTGKAWRVASGEAGLSPWARAALSADGGAIVRHDMAPVFRQPAQAAAARPIVATPAAIAVTRLADGRVRLTATPPPGASGLIVALKPSVDITQVSVAGRPLGASGKAGQAIQLRWQGGGGAALEFRPSGPGVLEVAFGVVSPGWPATAQPLAPLPANAMAWDISGSTVVTGTRRLRF